MITKHTAGPWTADGHTVYSADNRELVPDCSGDHDSMTYEEACANARLIAAAPALLVALRQCLDRDDIADCELGDVIRAAIAKAVQP